MQRIRTTWNACAFAFPGETGGASLKLAVSKSVPVYIGSPSCKDRPDAGKCLTLICVWLRHWRRPEDLTDSRSPRQSVRRGEESAVDLDCAGIPCGLKS